MKALFDRLMALLIVLRLIDGRGRLVLSTALIIVTTARALVSDDLGGVDGGAAFLVVAAFAARAVEHWLTIREQTVSRQVEERLRQLLEGFDTNFKALGGRLDRVEGELNRVAVREAWSRTGPKK